MVYAVQASNCKFYTGRAGYDWLSVNSVEAFTYSREGAEVRAESFNKYNAPLCGLTFKVVEQNFGTGEWK